MKCANCGAEIPVGCIYCANCGQEAQIVTEVNVLEDDLLRSMLKEKTPQEEAAGEEHKKREETRNRAGEQKRKKRRRRAVAVILVLAVVCAGLIGVIRYYQMHSVDYLTGKAQTAYRQRKYQSARNYLDQAVSVDPDCVQALLLLGQISADQKDLERAEELFLKVIGLDPSLKDAYVQLLKLYDEKGEYGKMTALRDGVTDPEIVAVFDNFLVQPPTIDKKSGNYREYFTVGLYTNQRNTQIYYTLDGSTPDAESTPYSGKIEISEQGEITLKAVCVDENGNCSELASASYRVALPMPDMPVATPDGGQFSSPENITVTVPEGTTVYYTWGDGEPDSSSRRYTGPIDMPEGNNVLSLVAIDENGMKSEILKCNYIYYPD